MSASTNSDPVVSKFDPGQWNRVSVLFIFPLKSEVVSSYVCCAKQSSLFNGAAQSWSAWLPALGFKRSRDLISRRWCKG